MARVIVSVIYVLVVLLVVWWAKSRDKKMGKLMESDFVVTCIKVVSAMIALGDSEDCSASCHIMFWHNERPMRIEMRVHADDWAWREQHAYDEIDETGSTYGKSQVRQFDSIIKAAGEKYPELKEVPNYESLGISCRADPKDEFHEWVVFERSIFVPSTDHLDALKMVVKRKFPNKVNI